MPARNGEQTEIVKQRDEVVGVGNVLRWEVVFQLSGDASRLDDVLYGAGGVLETPVLAHVVVLAQYVHQQRLPEATYVNNWKVRQNVIKNFKENSFMAGFVKKSCRFEKITTRIIG